MRFFTVAARGRRRPLPRARRDRANDANTIVVTALLAARRRRDAAPAAADRVARHRGGAARARGARASGSCGSVCVRCARSSRPPARSRRRPLASRRAGGRAAPRSAGSGSRSTRCSRRSRRAFKAREASERKLRRFVADASHELRTPLAAVRAYAELFTAAPIAGPTTSRARWRGITRESERMSLLVQDLLLLARLDEGRPLEREPVRLDEVVGEAVDTARAVEPDRPIDARRRATPSSSATATACGRSSTTC